VHGLDDHSRAGIDAEGMYCTYANMYLPSFSVAEPGAQSALFTAHNYQSLFVSWEKKKKKKKKKKNKKQKKKKKKKKQLKKKKK
jgi:ribulose kinase